MKLRSLHGNRDASKTWGGVAVAAMLWAYYSIFYFPPRLVGSNEPDRYYHLGLSRLTSENGLLFRLPQVEDLEWGRLFPDKEFLFHALSGAAYWVWGMPGVYLLVPILGIAIGLVLYWGASAPLTPVRAAAVTTAMMFVTPVFLFRITLLRPHLLAILFFSLLLVAILRERRWLAAASAAGFALSYHAFYIPGLVLLIAACCPPATHGYRAHPWVWGAAGLIIGVIVNPYFPANLVMSWEVVKIALGIGIAPGLTGGAELATLGAFEYAGFFGFLPIVVAFAALRMLLRRQFTDRRLAFLLVVSALLTALSFKSPRAIEYAVPSILLLLAHLLGPRPGSRGVFAACVALIAIQGYAAFHYYYDAWTNPQEGMTGAYLSAIAAIPEASKGGKVFNCQWEAGSYLLFARPDLRFIDVLDPALLWHAAPDKYIAREHLLAGRMQNPATIMRDMFHADYVLCGSQPLNQQMAGDPRHFRPIRIDGPPSPLHVFEVRK